jgi:DNA ligase (NAD+)
MLASEFGSIEKLRAASEEDLKRVEGVGPNMAREVFMFFDGQGGELVAKILAAGVAPQVAEAVGEGPFTGKTFVFTGTLETMGRPDAEALVRRMGGKAAGSVSARTDYVVAGPGAGSKLEKAQKLKLKILDEQEFLKLVGK